jgi:L-threonylcarbamoyladenylate synthase
VLPLPAHVPQQLPIALTAGRTNIAVRVPAHLLARALAAAAGGAITSTSANPSGSPAATTADAVMAALADRLGWVIDGGTTPGGAPSTIVDVSGTEPTLVRAGVIAWERVLKSLH